MSRKKPDPASATDSQINAARAGAKPFRPRIVTPPEEPPEPQGAAPGELPDIRVTVDMAAIVNAAESALLDKRPRAPLYQRGGRLVRVITDARQPKLVDRPLGSPTIDNVPEAHLTELCSRAACWWTWDSRKNPPDWKPSRPPQWVAPTLAARGSWRFPPLTAVIQAPTLRPDGTVLDRPGYDESTGLLFLPGAVKWPTVPKAPTREQAHDALTVLGEAFTDFPWLDDRCDRAAAIAAVLSLLARHAIAGPVPMFAARASTAGTGKSLLADVVSTIGTGRRAARMAPPRDRDRDEERKRLISLAGAGDPFVLIDNIAPGRPFGSEALDGALTSMEVSDRVLGKNTGKAILTLPWTAVVMVTGNNLTFRSDTGRRVIPVDLEANEEHPEERTGFTHDPLLPWVASERPRLVTAALTALRAYFIARCPRHNLTPFGSFEAWSDLVREALVWAGLPDPCESRLRIRAESDPERDDLSAALTAWYCTWKDAPMTLAAVLRTLKEDRGDELPLGDEPGPEAGAADLKTALQALCPGAGKELSARTLGTALRSNRGRIVGGLRFASRGKRHGAALWCVENIK